MNYPKIFPEIYTKRLLLRQSKINDVQEIFELRTNPEINRLITRKTPNNLEETAEFISICHQEFEKQNRIFWTMESKATKKVIGSIVFHNISLNDDYVEIGYELNPVFHNKGLMSEAMKAVLKFGKNSMNAKTIEAFTHQNNIASIALLEKHNFVFQPKRKCKVVENNRIFRLDIN